MGLKISEYVNAHALPIDTDLYDVSADIGGGSFQSRSIAWSVIKSNVTNLYKADGSLAGNRTVTMGVNELTFGSTGDANLLKLETTNDRIGIGTATPSEKLEVAGNTVINGLIGVTTAPNALIQMLLNTTLRDGINIGNTASVATNSSSLVARNLSTHPAGTAIGTTATTQNNITSGENIGVKAAASATGVTSINKAVEGVANGGLTNYGGYFQGSGGTNNYAIVTNGGNVGLGTLTPTEQLEVVGNIKQATTANTTSLVGGKFYVNNSGGLSQLFLDQTSYVTNNASLWQVGVLQVQGVATGGEFQQRIQGSIQQKLHVPASINDYKMSLGVGATITNKLIEFSANNGIGIQSGKIMHNINATHDFVIAEYDGAATTDLVTVQGSDGNVGIGTAAPSEKLDVVGNTKISGNLDVGTPSFGKASIVGSVSNVALNINSGSDSSAVKGIYITNLSTDLLFQVKSTGAADVKGLLTLGTAGVQLGSGQLTINNSANGSSHLMALSSGASANVFRINSNGNVGIGTAAPSEALDVVGNAYVNGNGSYNVAPTTTGLTVKADTAGVNALDVKNSASTNIFTINGAASNNVATFVLGGNNSFDVTGAAIFRGSSAGVNPFTVNNSAGVQLIQANSSGNVMIGAGFASEKFEVAGNADISGVYKVGGVAGVTQTGAYTNFTIVGGIITAAS